MDHVMQTYRKLRADPEHAANYGLNESKQMAISRVRALLQSQLDEDITNPYGNGPVWSTARLALFDSIYR
jgi:hypothetical protein